MRLVELAAAIAAVWFISLVGIRWLLWWADPTRVRKGEGRDDGKNEVGCGQIDAFVELCCRIGMRVLSSPSFIQALQLVRSFQTLTG